MKKFKLLALALMFTIVGMTLSSCDNRSQLQKDMDKAASQTEKAATDAQKKLGL